MSQGSQQGEFEDACKELGVKPVVAFKLFPPGGVYYSLAMIVVGYASNIMSVATFLINKKYFLGVGLSIFLLVAIIYTFQIFSGGIPQIWKYANRSVTTRVLAMEFQFFLMITAFTKDAYVNLVAPYGTLCVANLTTFAAANNAFNLLLHLYSMGQLMVNSHLGEAQVQFGRPIVHRKYGSGRLYLLTVWSMSTIASQSVLTAIFTMAYHWSISVLMLVPVALVYGWTARPIKEVTEPSIGDRCVQALRVLVEPIHLIGVVDCSVFGLMQWNVITEKNEGHSPGALPTCLAQVARVCIMLVMLLIDFPSVHMGSGAFRQDFLEPAITVLQGSHSPGAAFRALLLCIVLPSLPLYLVTTAIHLWYSNLLCVNPDGGACEEMTAQQEKLYDAAGVSSDERSFAVDELQMQIVTCCIGDTAVAGGSALCKASTDRKRPYCGDSAIPNQDSGSNPDYIRM